MAKRSAPRVSAEYATHRENLARSRMQQWSNEYFRLLDKADSRKSKAWRSRDLAEAERARVLATKAERDALLWDDRAAQYRERDAARVAERRERETRRAERAGTPEEAGARAQRYLERQTALELEIDGLHQEYNRARTRKAREEISRRIERLVGRHGKASAEADKWLDEEERRRKIISDIVARTRYEYVLKVSYKPRGKKGRKPKHHAVWWDVRLRRRDGQRATKAELDAAVRAVRGGGMLPGWEVLAIGWDRGTRPGWDDEPARWAEDPSEVDAALGQLANTLGRDEGGDYVVGEEERR